MSSDQRNLPKRVFPFIWYFLRPYKTVVVLYIFLSILAGFWGPFDSILIKNVIDLLPHIQDENISKLFLPVSLIVLNFIVFDNVTWRALTYIRAKFNPKIINRMIEVTMEHVLSHSNHFFQNNLTGKISKQISNLADSTEILISAVASSFLRGASHLLISFITAYFVNPIFCMVLIGWFIIFCGISVLMAKQLAALSETQASTESSVIGELVDTISNQSNVRIFSKKSYESLRMTPYFRKQEDAYTNTHIYALITHAVQAGLIAAMMALSTYFLIKLYAKQLVTIGDFALIFGLSMNTGHLIWFTMHQVDELYKAIGRCKQSLQAIMVPLDITDKTNALALQCSQGEIRFDRVQFQYKESKPIFQDMSVKIASGEKIGLVGYSGGGKSTFAHLIMRLYDISKGEITIDGIDIRDVTQDSLHENIGMIPQDPVLFQRSLMENIRYGNINATDDEVVNAAKKAHAHEFIVGLESGYSSLVGERGIKLSGGQRQRIAIARAILKNAPILILDEATSQLDSITEAIIQESLWTLMRNKTTIVIAHRLSTLLHMDRILVFDKGQIVESGSHANLLAQGKLYKKLWDSQVGGFLGDDVITTK